MLISCSGWLLLAAQTGMPNAVASDWPQWCGRSDRNMVSTEQGLPDRFDEVDGKVAEGKGNKNVKWSARLAGCTFGSPVIVGGKIFLGGNDNDLETAVLWCFRESDGQLLWKMRSPLCLELVNRSFGICSTPVVEGDRVYVMNHLGDVLCLDANGLAGRAPSQTDLELLVDDRERTKSEIAPDGHRIIECTPGKQLEALPTDAHILWRFDLLREVNCWPYNAQSGSILLRGDRLYVPTGTVSAENGHDGAKVPTNRWKLQQNQAHYPSPSLIVLDKQTGKLLARDEEGIFDRTFHGAQSSPSLGVVNGKELLFYGGGDGTCYAFDPDFAPGTDGKPGVLKLVWKFNCTDPATYDASYQGVKLDRGEIMGTPVFYKNRVYVPIGNDLKRSGESAKGGRLLCLDATKSGDITGSGKIWSFDDIRSTASTVAVADGLLYTGDAAGNIYCLDADTGKLYWQHKASSVWSSPLVADGRLYIADRYKGLFIFATGKEKKLLGQLKVNTDIVSSPAVANGVFYIASMKYFYALQKGKQAELAMPMFAQHSIEKMQQQRRLKPWQRALKVASYLGGVLVVAGLGVWWRRRSGKQTVKPVAGSNPGQS